MENQKKLKIFIIVIGIILFLAISAFTGMKYSSKPDFCTNCHIMKPAKEAWAKLSHKDVNCLSCHAEPGFNGYVKKKIKGLNELYIYVSGKYDGKFEVILDISNCINCHSSNSTFANAKDITAEAGPKAPAFPHQDVLKDKTSCLQCHRTIAHGETKSVQSNK